MNVFAKTVALAGALAFSQTLFSQTNCGPQITCKAGLTGELNIDPNYGYPLFTSFASDFVETASDSCFAPGQLVFGLRNIWINPGTGFPLGPDGQPQSWLIWDCWQAFGGPFTVEVWAKDPAGNVAMCSSLLFLNDNTYSCEPAPPVLLGYIKTRQQWADNDTKGIASARVSVDSLPWNLPSIETDNNGYFLTQGVPMNTSVTITPRKGINPLNGISTFDLVRMSKHVLGIAPFTSPFEWIAADINRNGTVSTFDIVEARKLILGIYTDFPDNASWRFVPRSFQFTTAAPLTEPFPEKISLATSINWYMANSGQSSNDFTGIKIGDVTGDAIPSNLAAPAADRNDGTFFFSLENKKVRAGDEFEVEFTGSEEVAGGQFDLHFDGLRFLENLPGDGLSPENFAFFERENRLSCSFNESCRPRFSAKFRAERDGDLAHFFEIKSGRLRPEAYRETDGARLGIALAPRENLAGAAGFELFQNWPNPFLEETTIGFNLPEAGAARLRVFDATGQALLEKTGGFGAGVQSFLLKKGEIGGGAAGCLFYQIETAGGTSVRRMVVR